MKTLIRVPGAADAKSAYRMLKKQLVWGYETEDNLNIIETVDYGRVTDPWATRNCFRIRKLGVSVWDVLSCVPRDKMTKELRKDFPEITESQVEAAVGFAQMLMGMFDRMVVGEERKGSRKKRSRR